MTQQISTVRRDLNIENRVGRKEIDNQCANLCVGRQNQKARCIFAQAELDRAAKHSFRFDAAQFASANFSSVSQPRAWQCQRNFVADFVIGSAANNVSFGAAAIVHFANREAIGVRVLR